MLAVTHSEKKRGAKTAPQRDQRGAVFQNGSTEASSWLHIFSECMGSLTVRIVAGEAGTDRNIGNIYG